MKIRTLMLTLLLMFTLLGCASPDVQDSTAQVDDSVIANDSGIEDTTAASEQLPPSIAAKDAETTTAVGNNSATGGMSDTVYDMFKELKGVPSWSNCVNMVVNGASVDGIYLNRNDAHVSVDYSNDSVDNAEIQTVAYYVTLLRMFVDFQDGVIQWGTDDELANMFGFETYADMEDVGCAFGVYDLDEIFSDVLDDALSGVGSTLSPTDVSDDLDLQRIQLDSYPELWVPGSEGFNLPNTLWLDYNGTLIGICAKGAEQFTKIDPDDGSVSSYAILTNTGDVLKANWVELIQNYQLTSSTCMVLSNAPVMVFSKARLLDSTESIFDTISNTINTTFDWNVLYHHSVEISDSDAQVISDIIGRYFGLNIETTSDSMVESESYANTGINSEASFSDE
ncbi:MAG: hypothetical protein NC548_11155 [Lachnospiraceae bacterium]|nr:hypothetical protein [Lachnospiraceae bacterium]